MSASCYLSVSFLDALRPVRLGLKYLYLVAMNDLVDILALPDVGATWQSPDEAGVESVPG